MKHTPKERNSADNEHRTTEISASKTYSGEASPYNDWVENHNDYDPLEGGRIDADGAMYEQFPMSEGVLALWEGFKAVYPTLLGQQKKVVALLIDGQWNQQAIAIQMGISQQAVSELIGKIRKKIEKRMSVTKDL